MRLQAKRHGAGLVVSEMVSSFGLVHGDARTHREFLRIHPDEHPVSMQLFGHDAAVMREAGAIAAAAGADLIDLNMGCPVRKVCRTGAGAALLDDPDRAVEIARAAREGSGLPVTVKLRPGREPGDRAGVRLARRLVEEAGVAGIAFHPRHASQQHSGAPDYALARELVEALPVPVILSGGLSSEDKVRRAFDESGAAAVMLARGALGNPWMFDRLLGTYEGEPTPEEILDELEWVIASRRGPPRRGPRGPLFAQVLPLVRGPPGPHQARAPRARHGAHARPMRGPHSSRFAGPPRRSQPDLNGHFGRVCCCYTPASPREEERGFSHGTRDRPHT